MNRRRPETPFNTCLEVVKPIWYPFYFTFEHSLHPVWSYLCPLSTYHEERREQKRLKAAAKRLDDEFKQLQVENHRPIPATNAPAYPSGPLFTKVPPDVRREILIEAFGAQTVHLDLDVVEKARGQRSVKSWQWMSCVCHSKRPDLPHEPLYRRHFLHRETQRDPLACPKSQGNPSHSGRCPRDCLVGASGWLLSCRQAYDKGIEVLYRTNTIHIESLSLLRGMHEFVAPYKMALITSFTMTMSPNIMIFDEIFCGLSPKECPNSFRFPSLARLHLICGIKSSLAYPIDRLVRRIASSRTEVTVFCASWEVYTTVDLKLAKNQGVEKTRMHWADAGGLRCWREMTPKEGVDSYAVPRGYWIHFSNQLMPSHHGDLLCDGRRIDLYNLRDHETRLNKKFIIGSEAEEDGISDSF